MSARDLLRLTPKLSPSDVWPEPLPLYRDYEPSDPYPIPSLGPLSPVVEEAFRIIQAPDALVAGSFLAAASMATQGLANIELDGRTIPLSLYMLSIGDSGERKSAVDAVATRPLRVFQDRLHLSQMNAISVWEGKISVWEADRKRIIGQRGISSREREIALEELGPPPPKPWSGLILTTEPTFEGLTRLLADGWPVVGLFAAEGGSFLGGHAMSREHRLRTIAGLSELWDGRAIDRIRVGDEMRLLLNRRLALHLLAQPIVARGLLGDPLAQGQGLLARMLVSAPMSTAGSRRYISEAVENTNAYANFYARISYALECVERSLRDPDTRRHGLRLRSLSLSPAAKPLWIRFYEHIEGHLNAELAPIRAFAAKLAEHCLRLAGVLALYNDPDAAEIDREILEQSITLCEWYGSEALRLSSGFRVPYELALANETLDWMVKHTAGRTPRLIHLAEVYRLGPPQVRSARTARNALRILEEHGYVAYRPNSEVEGKTRRDVWEVSPKI